MECSLTQALDRPQTGRVFFEEVIRENLDMGRPDHVQLLFSRRITKRTPGRFRTRVITDGVVPSLHVDYKDCRIKQYLKAVPEGYALRTETTINNAYNFAIGRRLHNLPALRAIGFQANRRLLAIERLSHDCLIGEELLPELERQQRQGKDVVVRADAGFAKPELYEALEARGVKYAIRIPSNRHAGAGRRGAASAPRGTTEP
jgi:hypothetical protein